MSASDLNINELAKSIDRMLKRRGLKDVKLGALSLHRDVGDTEKQCWKRVCRIDENGRQVCKWVVEDPCR